MVWYGMVWHGRYGKNDMAWQVWYGKNGMARMEVREHTEVSTNFPDKKASKV
jgi:hypothetical protein